MTSGAYYNEIDPFKAEVIREAIKAGAIALGEVDERSIADVRPAELVGRLRLYGDAICVPAAVEFIQAFLEAEEFLI